MAEENATCTYLIDEPFATALKRLRTALAGANLGITGELDLSARLRRALLVNIPPCLVLFAAPSTRATEELAVDPCVAALTPLHIVVSARAAQTEVHLLRAMPRLAGPLERSALMALGRLQTAIHYLIEKIGMRSLDA